MPVDLSRYSLDKLVGALRNPDELIGELRHIGKELNRMYYSYRGGPAKSTSVMGEDWDNLLILDSARYDTFSEMNYLPGELECRISHGSSSREFLHENFDGREYFDTVYVSANPLTYEVVDAFHDVINLYETHWDDEVEVTLPEAVADAAVTAEEEYPEKRLLIHFMQPHTPFIGELGQTFYNTGVGPKSSDTEDDYKFWTALQYGRLDASTERVWEAYYENLDIVLSTVEELLGELGGKSVVTADHGQLIGDRLRPIPTRGYGHFGSLHVEQLVKVPWLVVDSDDRRVVRSHPRVPQDEVDQRVIEDRLEKLGYR